MMLNFIYINIIYVYIYIYIYIYIYMYIYIYLSEAIFIILNCISKWFIIIELYFKNKGCIKINAISFNL